LIFEHNINQTGGRSFLQYTPTAPHLPLPTDPFFFDVGSLYEYFEQLTDRRSARGRRYPLPVALVLIILAKLAGEQEACGIAQGVALRQSLLYAAWHFARDTVPHPTTYARILGHAVDVEQLQQAAAAFLLAASTVSNAVTLNLDGKLLKGAIPAGQTNGVHLLAAYLPDAGIVLMQMEVGRKENEIVVAPRVLKTVDLQGKIVTGDAMFAQRELSLQVVKGGGNYLWSIKDNQPDLRADIEALFAIEEGRTALQVMANDFQEAVSLDKAHGRLEQRRLTSRAMLGGESKWPHLQQVFKIGREIEQLKTGKRRSEIRYGVTSLSRQEADAACLLEMVRKHWEIENGLHYRRDWTLREDYCRLKTGSAAQAMAVLNNLAISLVRQAGFEYLPDGRRKYSAQPLEALKLILRR
jgi:predicted transposase YbfD/YdcC